MEMSDGATVADRNLAEKACAKKNFTEGHGEHGEIPLTIILSSTRSMTLYETVGRLVEP